MIIHYSDQMGAYVPNKSDPDYIRGIKILQVYHNYMLQYPSVYKISFNDLITIMEKKMSTIVEGVGLAANINDMSNSDCEDAMQALAEGGQGKIPDNWQAWSNALGQVAMNPGFFAALKYTAVETAKDVGTGFQEIGNTLITTMKIGKYVFPVLAIGGAVLFVWFKIKPRRT